MSVETAVHAVLLQDKIVGHIHQAGDVARFIFDESYWADPNRHVLGLYFEDNPSVSPQAANKLPCWFSNLLPEGKLRDFIAEDAGVKLSRELQILLRIGEDLPGAVRVVRDVDSEIDVSQLADVADSDQNGLQDDYLWKFSLAGVGMKLSMLRAEDRLTMPASDELGNWIVKFPTPEFAHVPENEFAMMSIASRVGIEVPQIRLVHRNQLPWLSAKVWPKGEELAFAIERFDRDTAGGRIHIEDMAQVQNKYPQDKYSGNFESVAGLFYRGVDRRSLEEFIRRLVLNMLVGNGDAHMKNWSLIYRDGVRATISPAYDIVCTGAYYSDRAPDDLGLKFNKRKEFSSISRGGFERIAFKLKLDPAVILDVVDETLQLFEETWQDQQIKKLVPSNIEGWLGRHSQQTLRLLSA